MSTEKFFQHTETDGRGVRTTYSSPTFEGLVDIVVEARRKTKKVDYNRVFNELRMKGKNKLRAPQPKRALKLADAANGAKAALKNLGGQIVSQREIDDRAKICLRCPMLTKASDCPVCNKGAAVVNAWNTAKKLIGKNYEIPNGLKKTYCDVCGCSHSMILPARLEDFHPDDEEKAAKRPPSCWVHPTIN